MFWQFDVVLFLWVKALNGLKKRFIKLKHRNGKRSK